jgi:hypothetical protein
MENQIQRIVQKQLEAYNRKDLDAFVQCYSDSIRIGDLTALELRVERRDQLRGLYRQLFAQNPQLHCEILSRVTVGAFVIDEERVTGLARLPDGLHIAAIYRIESGLISEVWFTR